MNEANLFDFVVVGGGSAGAVAARRLAEREPDRSICLVEEGPSDEDRAEILDLSRWPELLFSVYDRGYAVEPQARGNSAIRQSRAVVLGGCSSHNGCGAWRLPDWDINAWIAAGATDWTGDAVRAAFDAVVSRTGIASADVGNPAADAFIRAGQEAGFPIRDFAADLDASRVGVGWTPLNAIEGKRRSSSVSFLHPLSELPDNLTVLTERAVDRIVFDGERATGVEGAWGSIEARIEVIVSCGSLDSPKLLMLSGIGPADHLRELDIDPLQDLPVGDGLLDHPEGVITFRLAREIVAPNTMFADAVLLGDVSGDSQPDVMMWFFTGHFDEFTLKSGAAKPKAVSFGLDVMHARSEGTVRLRSDDPRDAPRIALDYFTDAEGHDEQVMLRALKLARHLADQPALSDWLAEEIEPGDAVATDQALLDYVRSSAYTAYHPVATCRMGSPGDPAAVVDGQLLVYGLDNLRVADASVFPTIISVNPGMTCMMIGERCAQLISKNLASVRTRPGRARA